MANHNKDKVSNGFNRLKQAVVGAMGVGMAGLGIGAASSGGIPRSVFHAQGTKSTRTTGWSTIGNNSLGGSSVKTTGGFVFGGTKSSIKAFGIGNVAHQSRSYSGWLGNKYSSSPSNSNFYLWHASGPKAAGASFKNTTTSSSSSKSGTWFSLAPPSQATFGLCPTTNPNTKVSSLTLAGGFRDSEISAISGFWTLAGSGLTKTLTAQDCYITQQIVKSGTWSSFQAGTTWSDAFNNNALWMAVDRNFFINPDSDIDVSGDTLTTDVMEEISAGVNAQIEYFFHPSEQAVRARYLLTNTTSAPIDVELLVGGTLAGSSIEVHQTDSGDSTIGASDKWLIAGGEAEGEGSGNPNVLGLSRFGEGAAVKPEAAMPLTSNGVFANRYDVTLPVGRTVGVLVFLELFHDESDASAKAGAFNNWSSIAAAGGYLDGIGDAEIDQLVNYAPKVDTDSDGLGNTIDEDDDGDGTLDNLDAFPLDPTEDTDTDDDGVGDNADTDDDNDGTLDTLDAFPLDPAEDTDTDDDGLGNNADADDDGDGCSDAAESGLTDPLDAASTPPDTDTDGVCDPSDDDDDDDGAIDELDAFPLDPTEDTDTDEDGIGNNADTDDDDDGALDLEEELCLSDPLDAFSLPLDADGDGVCDALEEADIEEIVEPNDEDFMADLFSLFGGVNPLNLIFLSGVWLVSIFRKFRKKF